MHLVWCNEKAVIILESPRPFRLAPFPINQVLERLKIMAGLMPSEFAWQSRGLGEKMESYRIKDVCIIHTSNWYLDTKVQRSLETRKIYTFFVTISLHDEDSNIWSVYSGYVNRLLKYFVTNSMEYYGRTFASYNTHGLLHVWWFKPFSKTLRWHFLLPTWKLESNTEKIFSGST